MRCAHCNEEISDVDARWAFDEPYCDTCFDELFNYCSRCDGVISSGNTNYNGSGDPLCSDCYDEEIDEDAPDNPDVSDTDRKHIVNLSRSWLQGNVDNRRYISINVKDHHLKTIREKVGLVEQQIYLFGLKDRDEYQISASSDIIEKVKEFFPDNIIIEADGVNRLGISLDLRQNLQTLIINLIKEITSTAVAA